MMIELTNKSDNAKIQVRAELIAYFYLTGTYTTLRIDAGFLNVTETPAEILALL